VSGTFAVNGPSTFTGTVSTGNTNIGGTLNVTGASSLTGAVTTTNNVTVGGNLGVGITPTSKLHVSGNANITGNTTVGGTLTASTLSTSSDISCTTLNCSALVASANVSATSYDGLTADFETSLTSDKIIFAYNGDLLSSVPGLRGRSVSGKNAHIIMGQSDVRNYFQVWIFNSTLANAFMKMTTWNAANPICMQGDGNGRVCIGVPDSIAGANQTYGRLHLANSATPTQNPIIFEAGALADGTSTGVSAMNFNGYTFSSGSQRINTGKNRWRIVCNQNSTNDRMTIDRFDGTTNRDVMRFDSNNIFCPNVQTFAIGAFTGPYGKLQLASGNDVNNIVFEAGQLSDNTNSGFSAMNFNGYFSGGEQRINTSKTRWRLSCDQRSTNDTISIDNFDGATLQRFLSFRATGDSMGVPRMYRSPVHKRFVTEALGGSGTYNISSILGGLIHRTPSITSPSDSVPTYAAFIGAGFEVDDCFHFVVANLGSVLTVSVNANSGGTNFGSSVIGANGIGNFMARLTDAGGGAVDLYRLNN